MHEPSEPVAPVVATTSEPALRIDWAGVDAWLADPRDEELRFAARHLLQSVLPGFLGGIDWVLECLRWPCLLVVDGEAATPRGQLTVRTSSTEAALALASSFEPVLQILSSAGTASEVRSGLKVATTAAGELFFGCEQADFFVALGEPRAPEFQPKARDLAPELEPRILLTLDAKRLSAMAWPAALELGADPAQRLARLEGWPSTFEFGCAGERSNWVWRTNAEAREDAALPNASLALVPSSAVQASVGHGVPAALLDVEALPLSVAYLGGFVESHRELASALVASLGKAFGIYSIEAPWRESGFATVAFAEVMDAARLESALASMLELLEQRPTAPTERFELKTVTLAGVKARVLTLGRLPRTVEVALAIHGGHVFLAETARALELALALPRSGASLLDRSELAGARGAGLHSLSFTDVARVATALEPLHALLFELLTRPPGERTHAQSKSLHERLVGAHPSIEQVTLEHGQLVTRGTGDSSLHALFCSQSIQGSSFAGALFQSIDAPAPPPANEVERAEADLRALCNAVDSYAIENAGRYPDSLMALVTPDEAGFTYLKGTEVPRDPWGREYGFEWDGSHPDGPRVFSLGADGLPGGTGADRDLDGRELSRLAPK